MVWKNKKVLLTLKAYPEYSTKHGPVVCTGGLTEEGEWIRLYPITLNLFSGKNKVRKYDWIEVECQKAKEKLNRKESYRIRPDTLRVVDRELSLKKIKGKVNWKARNDFILPRRAPSLEYLKERFEEDRTSLGLVKAAELLDFYSKGELEIYNHPKGFQEDLFGLRQPVVEQIPHIFSYRFRCQDCEPEKSHDIQCEDWELFESYRSWGLKYREPELLWEKLYDKYYVKMKEKNLHFYMGTHSQFPTWLIIGLYYPPKDVTKSAEPVQTTL
jgi:hypothetical protein